MSNEAKRSRIKENEPVHAMSNPLQHWIFSSIKNIVYFIFNFNGGEFIALVKVVSSMSNRNHETGE